MSRVRFRNLFLDIPLIKDWKRMTSFPMVRDLGELMYGGKYKVSGICKR